MARKIHIDAVSQVDPALITFNNLAVKYETGQSVYVRGTGRDKVCRYRNGKMTEIGDIEVSVWKELVNQLIKKNGNEELINHFREWIHDSIPWIRNDNHADEYAYELYVSQMNQNRTWWGYTRFNMIYCPERIENDSSLLQVLMNCCQKPCRVPAEGIRQNHLEQRIISCPFCGKESTFTCL